MFHDKTYIPILALSRAELIAYEELPNKDKDLLIPIIPIKGWCSAKKLSSAINKVNSALGNRKWIASIDIDYIKNNKEFLITGEYPRSVFYEIAELLEPKNNYERWRTFVRENENLIPTIQHQDSSAIQKQIEFFDSLGRGMAVVFSPKDINEGKHIFTLLKIKEFQPQNIIVIYDFGTIFKRDDDLIQAISTIIDSTIKIIDSIPICISASSFPSDFSKRGEGEIQIYERFIFNQIRNKHPFVNLIYSDHGSARVEKQNGGGGTPAPRIDYPLKDDWRFIRKEFSDTNSDIDKDEKNHLYTQIAIEMLSKNYWMPELKLWGTRMIEQTSLGDKFGINSPQCSTAVRINIHLYNQLHYNTNIDEIDTDEDWED